MLLEGKWRAKTVCSVPSCTYGPGHLYATNYGVGVTSQRLAAGLYISGHLGVSEMIFDVERPVA